MSMDIREQWQGTKLVLSLSGPLDGLSSPELEKKLAQLQDEKNVTFLVFDFSELTYISSMGIRVILKAIKWMNAEKGKLSVINIPEVVREVFQLTGLIDLFIHDEELVIIETGKTATKITLSLAGRLDATTFPMLNEKFEQLAMERVSLIILDCAKLSNPLSSDVQQLMDRAGKRFNERQKRLVIRNLSGS
jgi:anti-sigma B factor antagonist